MRRCTALLFACSLAFLCMAFSGTPAHGARSVLVVGDSLSIPLGKQLEHYFSLRPEVRFKRLGKVSSGLARPDFFDWEANLESLVRTEPPDLLLVMLGTNDYKPIPKDPGSLRFASKAWNREYARRVQRLVDIARSHNPRVRIHWVGAPVMGKADLDRGVRHINAVIATQLSRTPGCHFIDTRPSLADGAGRYLQYAPSENGRVKLRADDGIHVTAQGAALLADACLQAMQHKSQPAAATIRTASATERSKPARAVAAVHQAPAAAKRAYAIQESSWGDAASAKHRAGQLSGKGIAAWVTWVDLGAKGVWHRVMIGAFESLDNAKRHKVALSQRYALSHTLIIRLG